MNNKTEKRKQHFFILLYEEKLSAAMEYVRSRAESGAVDMYALIRHEPEENEKQVHWHLYLKMHSATTYHTVAQNLGIDERFVDICVNKYKSCAYLIHANDDSKIQYNIEQIECNDMETLVDYINKGTADMTDRELLDLFHSLVYSGEYDKLHQILFYITMNCNVSAGVIKKYTYYFNTFWRSFKNE